ncbi:MAG: flagellar basal body L-ring protein FlgH [Candidatus Korobacteraceae bacterium]
MKSRAAFPLIVMLLWAACGGAQAANKAKDQHTLEEYLSGLKEQPVAAVPGRTAGSLWSDNAGIGQLAADYKAGRLHDLIVINISEQTTANQTGMVNVQRSLSASSGITGLPGALKTTGVAQLFSPNSSYQLKGQGQAASNSTIQSTLSGTVVAVLANGDLVVEARHSILADNQHQDITLRGIVRPADIALGNSILSSQMSNLELTIRGKGVVSDGTRQPNIVMRTLLRLLNF